MNTAKRFLIQAQVTWPVFAMMAFWLPVLGPLVQPGRMTCSQDGPLQFLRAFQLDTLISQGVLWPRWSPGMVFGFGYPLFNYYPVLALYPVVILHRLGLSLLRSWNLVLALSVLASGWTMYLWARRIMSQRGAFVAAVAYMIAPYQLYDVYWRGTITESLTLPLMPLTLWAVLSTAQTRHWRYALAGALTYAAILLTHAPASLILTLVLLGYMMMLWWKAAERRTLAVQLAALLAIGLGLAAFFLFPAFLEKDQAQLWRAGPLGGMDFHKYFLLLRDLFGPLQAADPKLVNSPWPPHSLGWALSLLAVMACVAARWNRTRISAACKRHAVWAGLTLLAAILMMLPLSEPVWSRMPLLNTLLPFVQFPWRFLGVSSLAAAWLVGTGVSAVEGQAWSDHSLLHKNEIVLILPLVVLALGIYPWAYPRLCAMPENPNQAYYTDYELNTHVIGTSSFGEYLPVAVQTIPDTSPFVDALRAGQSISRWDAPGVHIEEAHDDGLHARLIMDTDAPLEVVYRAFYFPGWVAMLDGRAIPVTWQSPLGLMAMDVPQGRHTLELYFSSTRLRNISALISLVALAIVVAVWLINPRSTFACVPSTAWNSSPRTFLWAALLGIVLLMFKVGVADRLDTPLRSSRLDSLGRITGALTSQVVVADRLRLLGYEIRPPRVPSGGVGVVDLYWAALHTPPDFGSTVRLLDQAGVEWSDRREPYQVLGGYNSPPSARDWPAGSYADDRHALQVLPGTPPGAYLLTVVPFKPDTLEPLPVSMGQAAPVGQPGIVIGTLEVISPARPVSVDALGLAVRIDAPVGPALTLTGYSQDVNQAEPGQAMLVTLGWQTYRQPQIDYTGSIELIAGDGSLIAQQPFAPGGERFPSSRWAAGQVIRSQVMARIPGRATSGQYTWRVKLVNGSALVGQVTLAPFQINAPARLFSRPSIAYPLDVRLGNWFALVGFDMPASVASGESLPVRLVWRSLEETDRNFKVFVHLLDAQRRSVAQSDAVPANWARPTAGWQVGEFVTDAHALELARVSPGEYHLVAGMYEVDSGRRLLLADGSDTIELGTLLVTAGKP